MWKRPYALSAGGVDGGPRGGQVRAPLRPARQPVLQVVAGGWQQDGEGPTAAAPRGVLHIPPGGWEECGERPGVGVVIAGGMRWMLAALPRPAPPLGPGSPRSAPPLRPRAPASAVVAGRAGPPCGLGKRPGHPAPPRSARQPVLQVVAGGWQHDGEGLTVAALRGVLHIPPGGWEECGERPRCPGSERVRARKRGGAAIAAPPPVLRPSRVSPVPPGTGEIGGCSGVTP